VAVHRPVRAELGGELIANKPLVVSYQGQLYFPAFKRYTEQQFGGELPFQADYAAPTCRTDQGTAAGCCSADPVQRRHAQLRPEPTGPEPALGGQLAGHRRSGARRAGAGDFRHRVSICLP
jgi:hypothetical protein